MAVIETWLHQDLQEPVKVNHLDGNLFSNNGNGNRIGVVLTNNGEALASISGTVSGYAVTADGSTVPCTGSKSGNRASILIPAAAYQPGSIFITVFITDGTTVTTVAAVSSTVMRSRTNAQVDPGSVVTDWTQTINAAMQSVETAAENLGGIVAVPYASITFPVPLGKYTYHNNNLYRCITPIASSESFTAAHWTQVRLGDDVSDLKSAMNESDIVTMAYLYKMMSGQDAIPLIWENGTINDTTGQPAPHTKECRTQFIPTVKGITITIDSTASAYYYIAKYDKNKTFIEMSSALRSASFSGDTSAYVRVCGYASTREAFLNGITVSMSIDKSLQSLYDKIENEIKNNVGEITGNEPIFFTKGGYITSGNDPISTTPTTNANWQYAIVSCSPGEKFTITANGASAPRAYMFVDANLNQIETSALNMDFFEWEIVAPTSSAYLVLNKNATNNGISFRGHYHLPDFLQYRTEIEKLMNAEIIQYQKHSAIINNGTTLGALNYNTLWEYAIIPCSSGDVFTITGDYGGTTLTPWAFVDSSDNIILKSSQSTLDYAVIKAPANSAKLVLNKLISHAGFSLKGRLEDYILKTNDNAILNVIGITPIIFEPGFVPNAETTVNINTVNLNYLWEHAVVACSAGDIFNVSGDSAYAPRCWSFVDQNGNNLFFATNSTEFNNVSLKAPTNSAYLVINKLVAHNCVSYKGVQLYDGFDYTYNDIGNITGNKIITFMSGYIRNDSGTVDINSPIYLNPNLQYAVVSCAEGDVFTVNGDGASVARAWAFINSSGTILLNSGDYVDAVNELITAPAGSAYLIINKQKTNKNHSYYGKLIKLSGGADSAITSKTGFEFIKNNPLGSSEWISSFTFVGNELWVFVPSYDDHTNTKPVYIFNYNPSTYSLTLSATLSHNLGHCNTVDYCAENDTLILGNGGGNDNPENDQIYIIENASALKTQGSIVLSQDAKIIDIDTIGLDWGKQLNVCWAYANNGAHDLAYAISNDGTNQDIRLIQLGKGSNQLTYGTLLSVGSDEFNGTFSILGRWRRPYSDTICNQDTQFYCGALYETVGHGTIWTCKMKLLDDSMINQEYTQNDLYDSTGSKRTVVAEGMAIKDGIMVVGNATDCTIGMYKMI